MRALVVVLFLALALPAWPETAGKGSSPFLTDREQMETMETMLFICSNQFVAIPAWPDGWVVVRKRLINAVVFQTNRTFVTLSSSRPNHVPVNMETAGRVSECLAGPLDLRK